MKENPDSLPDEMEHVFRFRLDSSGKLQPDEDPLVDMMRRFIADFLDIGCFTHQGKSVQVDGFTLTCDPGTIYPVANDEWVENGSTRTSFSKTWRRDYD